MKKIFLVIPVILFLTVVVISCKKKTDNTDPSQQKALVFNSLTASDTIVKIGAFTTLSATADGDELVYSWGSESGYGNIVGSGAVIQWSVCHADRFLVYCEVQDKYGAKIKKTIAINVQP